MNDQYVVTFKDPDGEPAFEFAEDAAALKARVTQLKDIVCTDIKCYVQIETP